MKKISKSLLVFILIFIFAGQATGQSAPALQDLLVYESAAGKIRKVKTLRQWQKKRDQILYGMQQVWDHYLMHQKSTS